MAYTYENELNSLKNAQRAAATADLQNTRDTALSNLNAEQTKNAANYNAQRTSANVQNKLGARNFQEYLASTGRANSGLSAQARMQNRNNLNTQLNSITGAENAANADINRRITDVNNSYNTGLASANANIEANYINNLLDQRAKAEQLAQQEREFNEQVRQFNERMALERQQLYSNFNSGSRKSSKSGSGSTSNDEAFTETTPKALAKGGITSVAQGISNKDTKVLDKTKWDGTSIGQVGNSSVKLIPNNGHYFYKTTSGWKLYK